MIYDDTKAPETEGDQEITDLTGIHIMDHLIIRDPDTGEVMASIRGSAKPTGLTDD